MVMRAIKSVDALNSQTGNARALPKAPAAKTSPQLGPAKSSLSAKIIGFMTVALIAFGYMIRNQEIFVPSEGIGYRLGLIGGCAMLLLLLYPMIKRSRFFGTGASAAFWFRWHMLLGTVGPLMIFYHSNFRLGATNSNIALFAMIAVFLSGVIGRYVYGQVHNGMYGAKLEVGSYMANAARLMQGMSADLGGNSTAVTLEFAQSCDRILPKNAKLIGLIGNSILLPVKIRLAKSRIMTEVEKSVAANAAALRWTQAERRQHLGLARQHVSEFVIAVSRAAQLSLWERMFSLWHMLHVPLFFLLLVSGVIHVIAVHLY